MEADGQFSPDGRWVAYTSMESGTLEIYLHAYPPGGAKLRVSTEGGQRVRWARDGRELFYWAGLPPTRFMVVDIPAKDALKAAPKFEYAKN